VIGANGVGALLTILYYSFLEVVPTGSEVVTTPPAWILVFNITLTALLLLGGVVLGRAAEKHHPQWVKRIEAGESAARMPENVRREVVDYPFASAVSSLVMWAIAGFAFGYLPSGQIEAFFRVFGVGGVLSSVITYFAIERIWRPIVPFFLPDGKLSAIKAFRMSVLRRLALVFFLVGVYPVTMLAVVTLTRARAMLNAPNPEVIYSNMLIAAVFIGAVGILTSIGMAILVTHSIVEPLGQLQQAMEKVESNDLTAHVPVVSNDELGYVSERFNEMVGGLRRAEVLRNLLNLYVSPEVARAAIEQGTNLGGQVVHCTILFSDIRGFTSLSEKLPPDQLIALLNRYMSRMVDVVIANGGIVNKFGGDSLLAIFGTPLNPFDDHAARAIRAALEMQSALKEFNAEQAKTDAPILKIGIGIASGPAVAGNVGGEGRIEYTVIGDTVNLASRLQDLTKELHQDILANEPAIRAATKTFSIAVQPLEPVSVRGKAEPVNVYAVMHLT
jgi:class 3 adenylate cyclase